MKIICCLLLMLFSLVKISHCSDFSVSSVIQSHNNSVFVADNSSVNFISNMVYNARPIRALEGLIQKFDKDFDGKVELQKLVLDELDTSFFNRHLVRNIERQSIKSSNFIDYRFEHIDTIQIADRNVLFENDISINCIGNAKIFGSFDVLYGSDGLGQRNNLNFFISQKAFGGTFFYEMDLLDSGTHKFGFINVIS